MRWLLFVQPETGTPTLAHTMIRYYALYNVQARLAQLYGEDFTFAIDTNNAEWSVTIEWPLRFRVRPARERAAALLTLARPPGLR